MIRQRSASPVLVPPHKVAVVRALGGLGDLLCVVPALRALRFAFPEAAIYLVGLPWARAFVQRFADRVHGFVEFPGYPGIPERPAAPVGLSSFLGEVHALELDLAIQMHGNGLASNPFTVLLGAKRTAGFFLPGLYCPDEELFLPYPGDRPEIHRHLALIDFLGIPSSGDDLEWPVTERDLGELEDVAGARDLERHRYAVVHAGAREPLRRWSVEGFARIGDALAARGLEVVLTGAADEADVVSAVSERMQSPHRNLSGATSLGAFGALLAGARVLVSNDTGPSHLAAALRVPSVVIFTGSDRARWAPLDAALHRAVGRGMAEPHPCSSVVPGGSLCLRDGCTLPSRNGLKSFDSPLVDDVLGEVEGLLEAVPRG